jgi:hypothetical protein
VAGNWIGNASGIHNSTGTIKFDGTAPSITGNTDFNNVELSSSGIHTVANNITIANNLTINSGLALAYGGGANNTTTVGGDLLITNNTPLTIGSAAATKTITVTGDVQVDAGSSIAVGAFIRTHQLSIGGDLIADGDIDLATASNQVCDVTFTGATNTSISGTAAVCKFNSITVNKGVDPTSILEVTRLITMQTPIAAANYLNITSGTFKLSSASTIQPYFGNATLSAAAGKLHLNNAGATINSNGAGVVATYTLTGEMQLTSGTMNLGNGNDQLSVNANTSILTVEGATLNIGGSLSFTTAQSQFNMTSGAINIDPQQGSDNLLFTTHILSFASTHPANAVNFTGGTLTIVDPHSAAEAIGNTGMAL